MQVTVSKLLTQVTVVAVAALTLTACGNGGNSSSNSSAPAKSSVAKSTKKAQPKKPTAGGALQDGTYTLEETAYSNGYRVTMSMTVAGGKITKTTYDNVNEAGKSKTKDAAYEKKMKATSKTGPTEYIPALNKQFQESGADVAGIDVVSGATSSSLTFKNYAQQLVQAAQAGNTAPIKVQNAAAMKDGTYTLEEKNADNGYRTIFSITVAGGKITASDFDAVNAAGEKKSADAAYEKKMKAVNKVGPKEYTKALNAALVKTQTPAKVDVVSGATSTSNQFVLYAEQLINAAQAGAPTTISVDNLVYAH